ncbi:MAG TPA: rRNA maturation RNase YbeY [Bacteroidia bacterium]|nr:rRNA maturation RNase YbeY [Bacteroidia bacterium]
MNSPSSEIYFFPEDVKLTLRDKGKVRAWLIGIAQNHRYDILSLNYVFVTDRKLLRINTEYLGHDTLTDIITFDLRVGREKKISAEIYISVARVRENAKKYGCTFRDELHRVMAHGLLHLVGFRDKTSAEKERMRRQEEKALALRTF